jgi:hypothetical protein
MNGKEGLVAAVLEDPAGLARWRCRVWRELEAEQRPEREI